MWGGCGTAGLEWTEVVLFSVLVCVDVSVQNEDERQRLLSHIF